METSVAAGICKALGDINRLKIIKFLTNGEKCACEILEMLEITQPTLSHHMKILCECGLVSAKKDGKWSYYTLNCDKFSKFKDFIESFSCICQKDSGSNGRNSDCCEA